MIGGTVAYTSALSKASPGVQRAAHKLEKAEVNPYDFKPFEWTGTGIDCKGSLLCPWMDNLGKFRPLVSVLNMDYNYTEHELIGCTESPHWEQTCLFLEDVKRNLTGRSTLF